ncbi:hypothetical protein EGJ27_02790 [Pseudomonas sp. v388]|uniref:hypothetical protein n=1 Tax=Pseudomonas sp. v388 TaxID=2479849 RepID=UPI000F782343|nr:hypothetical protein [Pseudomonas sp. v388]RRV10563.1 hypothetical protein EGJ27_02790 [Pseudomonas sp. v388]
MSIQNTDQSDKNGKTIIPDTTDPLSPGRTDVKPSDKPGGDELPANEGEAPSEADEEEKRQESMPDTDVDNAEIDGQPNPR